MKHPKTNRGAFVELDSGAHGSARIGRLEVIQYLAGIASGTRHFIRGFNRHSLVRLGYSLRLIRELPRFPFDAISIVSRTRLQKVDPGSRVRLVLANDIRRRDYHLNESLRRDLRFH
jgi:hypothetical protein